MQRGSWVRSLIFFIVDNCLEALTVISIIGAIICLNIWGALLSIPIIIIAWLLFNVIEIRETLLQIEENTRGEFVSADDEQKTQENEKINSSEIDAENLKLLKHPIILIYVIISVISFVVSILINK